jgi:hypothetical protein
MKKRISMLMLVLFVTTVIVSVSDVKAAESDNEMSISAAGNSQDMACGQEKCGDAKEGCDKSGEKKAGCGK